MTSSTLLCDNMIIHSSSSAFKKAFLASIVDMAQFSFISISPVRKMLSVIEVFSRDVTTKFGTHLGNAESEQCHSHC